MWEIAAVAWQLPQPLGSTPPTQSRPRGSHALKDPWNRGIFSADGYPSACGFFSFSINPAVPIKGSLVRELARAAGARLRELP